MSVPVDAIILAGGRGMRLGGVQKPELLFGGASLLEHALTAVADAVTRVVVGDHYRGDEPGIIGVREYPRWGGPAAGIAAGLAALPIGGSPLIAVLAADLPYVREALPIVAERADLASPVDGWIAVDEQSRRQPLLAIYRRDPLARRCAELGNHMALAGASLRQLLAGLNLCIVDVPNRLCGDVDEPADAERFGIALPIRQDLPIRQVLR